MRVLLIEDEERLCEALTVILKKNMFAVDVANDGIIGQDLAESNIYDVVILDRMLPLKDGINVLKDIRRKGIKTPVIFLTAKDSVANRVEGLDAGADDYLIKPFATEELIARLRALSRRKHSELKNDVFTVASLNLEPSLSQVSDGINIVKLTFKETQLLELFMINHGKVLTKNQILDRVWGLDCTVDENSVEIYIYHLRKKLSGINGGCTIATIRGVGYCLREE